jgi:hypothetical protein
MATRIVELLDVQLNAGQEMLTRYHFQTVDDAALEADLVDSYITDPMPILATSQNQALAHVSIRHRLVYPTAELVAETPISPPLSGGDATDPAPPNATYSLKWTLGPTVHLGTDAGKHISKGGKHLPGVSMSQMDADALTPGPFNAAIANWVTHLRDMTAGTWNLVVVSFEVTPSHMVDTTTTRTITKAVVSPIVTKYAPVTGASVPSVSTQNTRKVLRGRTY